VKELPGYSVQDSPYCGNGMPQKETLDKFRTPVSFRILSSSLTSVTIFSVCCYSIVSISVAISMPIAYTKTRTFEGQKELAHTMVRLQLILFSISIGGF
jgi:hypothetical protein